jgi:hypothetical protein
MAAIGEQKNRAAADAFMLLLASLLSCHAPGAP